MRNLSISISRDRADSRVSVVIVEGVIDTVTAPALEEGLEGIINSGQTGIIVNLSAVEYISSAGWSLLISKASEIRKKGGDLKLANMMPNVLENYEMLEFDQIIDAFDNLDAARAAFNPVDKAGRP